MSLLEKDLARLAWSHLDLGLTAEEIQKASGEVQALPRESWYHCTYRACNLLLVYGGPHIDERIDINWLIDRKKSPALAGIIEDKIAPFFKKLPRIIVLHTPPHHSLKPHIDCAANEVGSFQPKLRVLLKGRPDDLYFLSKKKPITIRCPGPLYYMSGAFAHSLENRSSEDRYTLCFGSPWTFDDMKPEFLGRLLAGSQQAALYDTDIGNFPHEKYAKNPRLEQLIPLSRDTHVSIT